MDALEVGPEGVKKVFLQEGVGHACTEEMMDQAASFIGQHLLKRQRGMHILASLIFTLVLIKQYYSKIVIDTITNYQMSEC